MYGADPYASVPYAALGGVALIVAACVHTDIQLLYQCEIGLALVFVADASVAVCPCDSANEVC